MGKTILSNVRVKNETNAKVQSSKPLKSFRRDESSLFIFKFQNTHHTFQRQFIKHHTRIQFIPSNQNMIKNL